MDLSIFVDRYHPHDRSAGPVACEQHGVGMDEDRIASVSQERPPEPVVVLGGQISYEVYFQVHRTPGSVADPVPYMHLDWMLGGTVRATESLTRDEPDDPSIPARGSRHNQSCGG